MWHRNKLQSLLRIKKSHPAIYVDSPKAQTKEAKGDHCRDSTLYAQNKTLKFVEIVARLYLARVSVVDRVLIKVIVIKTN